MCNRKHPTNHAGTYFNASLKKTLTEQNDNIQLQAMKDNEFKTVPCCETLRECSESERHSLSSNTQLRKLTAQAGFLVFYETKLPILKLTLRAELFCVLRMEESTGFLLLFI